jgi:hypothetical protein
MKITIPLTKVSDKLFGEENIHGGKCEVTPSAPELEEANAEIAEMVKEVKQEKIYGFKG